MAVGANVPVGVAVGSGVGVAVEGASCSRTAAMTPVTAVTPDAAAILMHDPVLKDQGLLGRMLPTAPDSASGTRMWKEPPASADAAIRRYGARLLSILEAPLPMAEGKRNELAPRRLVLSAGARAAWIAFADHVEAQLGDAGGLAAIRPLANKLAEHAARIAGVLAIVNDLDAAEITTEAM